NPGAVAVAWARKSVCSHLSQVWRDGTSGLRRSRSWLRRDTLELGDLHRLGQAAELAWVEPSRADLEGRGRAGRDCAPKRVLGRGALAAGSEKAREQDVAG